MRQAGLERGCETGRSVALLLLLRKEILLLFCEQRSCPDFCNTGELRHGLGFAMLLLVLLLLLLLRGVEAPPQCLFTWVEFAPLEC